MAGGRPPLFAGLFPAELRDGRASGDGGVRWAEEAEDAEPGEDPRVFFFVPFLHLFLGAAGGAVGACCRGCCCCLVVVAVVVPACCPELRFDFFVVVAPFIGACCPGAVVDGDAGESALPRVCAAGVSESVAISSAIVSTVGEADGAAAVAVLVSRRGTSTKSPVSERGDWRGGEAGEARDQTISSSSEGESLAHLVLEVSETMSSEDESEVVIAVWRGKECGVGENGTRLRLFIGYGGRGRKGVSDNDTLSDPPIYQAAPVPCDRNLLNIDASCPDSPLQVPHHLRPLFLQHDSIVAFGS